MKITSAEYIKAAVKPDQYPVSTLPEIAFAGRSNVGKSSLINNLVRRKKLAQTSATPGKTRLIHFYDINHRFGFVDLPGYGYAKVSAEMRKSWRPMVEGYLKGRPNLVLVVVILDIRRDPSGDDAALADWLSHHRIPRLFVLTKADKLSGNERRKRRQSVRAGLGLAGEENLILFSAKTGEGRDPLWKEILRASGREGGRS
ncbi:MAG TPA: ribosome biogenesis GTP-binding protein YihA/YsxC [Syntrophales bacterium]|jgi:GTP-binding protein|nr:ribosome biogenesis GTP-binding protein YihA/YsxC [Syntrophales bacterium]HRT62032.1 ribosome biogenesis GTP-binding protein YihA/YsxC [Syntrophales bacterium]